tara:strand:+ start:30691 stop:32160 length:1470 start_codon:yes stop_codon:yes gene_type:complete
MKSVNFKNSILAASLTILAIGCAKSSHGPGDFGGGDVSQLKVSIDAAEAAINQQLSQFPLALNQAEYVFQNLKWLKQKENKSTFDFKSQGLTPTEDMRKANDLLNKYLEPALNKMFLDTTNSKTALQKFYELSVGIEKDQPCLSSKGVEHDGSSSLGEGKICLSAFRLASKLDHLSLSKGAISLIAHEFAHERDATEEEAKAVELFFGMFTFKDENLEPLSFDIDDNIQKLDQILLYLEGVQYYTDIDPNSLYGDKVSEMILKLQNADKRFEEAKAEVDENKRIAIDQLNNASNLTEEAKAAEIAELEASFQEALEAHKKAVQEEKAIYQNYIDLAYQEGRIVDMDHKYLCGEIGNLDVTSGTINRDSYHLGKHNMGLAISLQFRKSIFQYSFCGLIEQVNLLRDELGVPLKTTLNEYWQEYKSEQDEDEHLLGWLIAMDQRPFHVYEPQSTVYVREGLLQMKDIFLKMKSDLERYEVHRKKYLPAESN